MRDDQSKRICQMFQLASIVFKVKTDDELRKKTVSGIKADCDQNKNERSKLLWFQIKMIKPTFEIIKRVDT